MTWVNSGSGYVLAVREKLEPGCKVAFGTKPSDWPQWYEQNQQLNIEVDARVLEAVPDNKGEGYVIEVWRKNRAAESW